MLTVDEDPATIQVEVETLRKAGYLVEAVFDAEEALTKARRIPFDLVLTDMPLSFTQGIGFLKQLQEIDHTLPIIVCCPESRTWEALEATRQGAFHYLIKPFQAPDLLLKVRNALELRRLHGLVDLLDAKVRGRHRLGDLIGDSLGMQHVYQGIEQAASADMNLLVTGGPGAGKKLVASQIHRMSGRSEKPLFMISAETLGDAEGASMTRLFGASSGSTVILVEIAGLTLGVQRVLCRLLRLGEPVDDIRIISTTGTDLDCAMEDGMVLPELYIHLSGMQIKVPPLRERMEDLQLLAAHFFEQACSGTSAHSCTLSPRALEMLTGYDWPGNVGELERFVRRLAATSAHRVIGPRDFDAEARALLKSARVPTLAEYESDYVRRILTLAAGNMGKAAKLLGIPRSSFYRKFRKL